MFYILKKDFRWLKCINIFTPLFIGEVYGFASKQVNANAKVIKTMCFPFHSILFAIGNPSVDYFSLDVEGVELDILKTIPWNKVDIKAIIYLRLFESNIICYFSVVSMKRLYYITSFAIISDPEHRSGK